MNDRIEPAKTGRSSCRRCRRGIEKGELRFGADETGFYGDGESYSWFHLECAAQRMPDRALARLKEVGPSELPRFEQLVAACEQALLKSASKYPYGECAPSGRARCMRCGQAIAKGDLRVAVEREIKAGEFVQAGAGFLHPACAAEELDDPALGDLLQRNSPLLSGADKAALASLLPAAKSAPERDAAPRRTGRLAQKTAKPSAEGVGDELVYADELLEKGDPRGELIVVAAELAAVGIDDPRGPALAKRAAELTPAARAAWAKELGLGPRQVTLERGLPSRVKVRLRGKNATLPEHPWIVGYRVQDLDGKTLSKLLATRELPRLRHLELTDSALDWESFRAFCTSPAVKNLRTLDLDVNVGARGVHLLLTATRFEMLDHLAITWNYQATPDLRGYESVAGLRALRSLHLRDGATAETVTRLLASPLVQRLEELAVLGWAWPAKLPELPNLRRLAIRKGALLPASAKELVRAAETGRLPSLRRLDLTEAKADRTWTKKLRATFGDRLIDFTEG